MRRSEPRRVLLLQRVDEIGGQVVDRLPRRFEHPQNRTHVQQRIRGARHDGTHRPVVQHHLAVDEPGQAVIDQLARLLALRVDAHDGPVTRPHRRLGSLVGSRAQDGSLNAQDVGQIGTLAHAREELRDVGGVEPPAEQLIDGLQLGEVVVVVVRRPTDPPRRVEQAALSIGADIAGTDTRDPRQIIQPVLSQRDTPRPRSGCALALHRDNPCDHSSGRMLFASEVFSKLDSGDLRQSRVSDFTV
jgi:hypothetical protein